ncbi:hypothetical protein [Actinocrispum sp. NPDC049592]|uniref:hypothetical protein n=1 Tax=Actinocrispum sp. NPDC049592 TaxID=3154835 RepID=UPI003426CF1B
MDALAEVVRSGTLFGLDSSHSREVIHGVLRDEAHRCWETACEYDVVTFHRARRTLERGLWGQGFEVRVSRAPFAELVAALDVPLVHVSTALDGVQTHWQPSSEMIVVVGADGQVRSLKSAFLDSPVVRHRYRNQEGAMRDMMALVSRMPPRKRREWFYFNKPGPEDVNAWWLANCMAVTPMALVRWWDVPVATQVEFGVWAWEHAQSLGAVSPSMAACQIACHVAWAEDYHNTTEVPSVGSIVRPCLDLVTGSMSRMDKNLIDMAALHRYKLADTSEVDNWQARRLALATV